MEVTWVGVNDCAIGLDPATQLRKFYQVQESLYEAGARNFVFFNVPPTDRSPAGKFSRASLIIGRDSNSLRSQIGDWNVALAELATRFRQFHTDVDVLVYDVAALFAEVLDHPTKYGFRNASSYGGEDCVWLDILHPTSAMHKVIAADVARFLSVEGGENFQAKE
jgi:phospholipase/lecithinase/hemolysin